MFAQLFVGGQSHELRLDGICVFRIYQGDGANNFTQRAAYEAIRRAVLWHETVLDCGQERQNNARACRLNRNDVYAGRLAADNRQRSQNDRDESRALLNNKAVSQHGRKE